MSGDRFAERLAESGARDRSVYINGPLDEGFAPLRDALVFSTVCSGLIPRTCDDLGQVWVPRVTRILTTLAACRYSIHDLSRSRGEGEGNHARFNIPFELGIAVGYKSSATQADHDWLVIVPDGDAYASFVSDLAGFDLRRHDGTPPAVVRTATSWLWTLPPSARRHRPNAVAAALPSFTMARQQLDAEFAGIPPGSLLYEAAVETAPGTYGAENARYDLM